ncbi:hypothetical protein BD779DRAFT_317566 [Infundibulicybe gibba]|nr:hypothetical protein BD779DRAFT_317566 [Infundibulicybe gibba]
MDYARELAILPRHVFIASRNLEPGQVSGRLYSHIKRIRVQLERGGGRLEWFLPTSIRIGTGCSTAPEQTQAPPPPSSRRLATMNDANGRVVQHTPGTTVPTNPLKPRPYSTEDFAPGPALVEGKRGGPCDGQGNGRRPECRTRTPGRPLASQGTLDGLGSDGHEPRCCVPEGRTRAPSAHSGSLPGLSTQLKPYT